MAKVLVVRDSIRMFTENEYHTLLNKMALLGQAKTSYAKDTANGTISQNIGAKISELRIEIVLARSILLDFDKAILTNEDDVEHYLKSLRKALLQEIQNDKQIQI